MTDMLQGIDVSSCQGIINWLMVKSSGLVNYAFCKATEGGGIYIDPDFKNNWVGIASIGLIRGAYHFAHPSTITNEPLAEADHFVNTILAQNDLVDTDMLVLDIETVGTITTPPQFINWVLTFVERVEQRTGITPIIYTGKFFEHVGGIPDPATMKRLAHFPLWLAAYVQHPENFIPVEWRDLGWRFWQKSGDQAAAGDTILHVPGIGNGHVNVDKDEFIGNLDQLKDFARSLHLNLTQSQNTSPNPPEAPPTPVPLPDPPAPPPVVENAPQPVPEAPIANNSGDGSNSNFLALIISFLQRLFSGK